MTTDKYAAIAAAIINAMNSDALPAWRRPWRTMRAEGKATVPVNAVTGRAYRGINAFILWSHGDADMRYLTYRQARQLGGFVRKGERGTGVIFWKPTKYTKRDAVTGEESEKGSVLMRFYTVFNVAQCDGLTFPKARQPEEPAPAPLSPPELVAEVKEALGVSLGHGGDRAYYAPALDHIQMPAPEAFTSGDAYAATFLHESTHATGLPSRCDRKLEGRFGSHAYAAEELVAEFGAAFLCAALGVNSALEHHASYLSNWHELLKSDPKALVTATSKAQAAADFILGKLKPEAVTEEDSGDETEAPAGGEALPLAA